MKNPTIINRVEPIGNLTILHEAEPLLYTYKATKFKCRRVYCRCACGKEFTSILSKIKTGKTQSCGCLRGRKKDGSYAKRIAFTVKKRGTPKESCLKMIWNQYLRGAKRRNLCFELTLNEVESLIKQSCHYCGVPSTSIRRKTGYTHPFNWNGIDRKINSLGYTLENCVPCCPACNAAKSKQSKEEFLALVTKIFLHSCKQLSKYP